MERFVTFHTPFGWCGVVSGKLSIKRILLGYRSPSIVRASIEKLFPSANEEVDDLLRKGKEMIINYLHGGTVSLDLPIELSMATFFQRKVWKVTRSIPYGEVKTYGWLSQRLSKPKACRAIGGALASNPLPLIIPCHRVIKSDGKLGGFSLPGGTYLKQGLIELERANSNLLKNKEKLI